MTSFEQEIAEASQDYDLQLLDSQVAVLSHHVHCISIPTYMYMYKYNCTYRISLISTRTLNSIRPQIVSATWI